MPSITLSVPKEVKAKMQEFDEINWSGYIRKCILKKAEELATREALLRQLERERSLADWAVKLQRAGRKGRAKTLQRQGAP